MATEYILSLFSIRIRLHGRHQCGSSSLFVKTH